MTQSVATGSGSSGLRAAVADLLARFRRAAVDGVVPQHVFDENVRALALGDGERERLRHELARIGLPVRDMRVHTEGDRRPGEKVVQVRENDVNPRLRPVEDLLSRYADADGHITSRVLEGVARLAGLDVREAAQLRDGVLVRDSEAAPEDEGAPDGQGEDGHGEDGHGESAPSDMSPDAAPADLAEALAAAHAVFDVDRRQRRPGSRLLSAQAEVGLAVMVRGGAESIAREPEEEELKALPPDDLRIRARDCLVVHNQRLVHSLVRPHLEQGLDYDDLLQHGMLGLLRAARKFDPTKGFKFSTYATWWIRQAITRAVADEGALIRIPVHMHEQMRRVAKAERTLTAEGRYASAADVAVRCDMTLQKVEEIRRLTRRTDSLDRVIGDGATLGDFVARTHLLPSVDQQVIGDLFVEGVLDVVDTFTEREARILVRRLGLDGNEPSTLDDLGREFGVTRERIRQIEVKMRPVLRERVGAAGLVRLDTLCEKAELAAERAAEVKRAARYVRAVHAARTARARLALRKARVERLARSTRGPARQQGRWPESEQVAEAIVPIAAAGERKDTADAAAPNAVAEGNCRDEAVGEVGEAADARASKAITADWERACRMAEAPVDQVSWLADYARAALGDDGLATLLGQSAADLVVRGAPGDERLSRPVLTALEVLRRVFDALVEAGQRPEDFFDRPAEALRGATPRSYLAARPLVNRESRLAVRDSLREMLAAASGGDRAAEEPVQTGVAAQAQDQEPESRADQVEQASVVAESDAPAAAPQTTADWDKALTLTQPPLGGGVPWLAEYALLALGHLQLTVLLGGPSVTDAVVRSARQRGMLDRPVVEALEVVRAVLDAVRDAGLRPEHFFERPVASLAGATPRAYLASRPLVGTESRVAVRTALQEFVAGHRAVPSAESVPVGRPLVGVGPSLSHADADSNADTDVDAEVTATAEATVGAHTESDVDAHTRYEADLAVLAQKHERRLNEVRDAADERIAAVRTEAERQLDALEEELLHRADRARERRAEHVRLQAEEHVAELEERHREACVALLRRAELAEEVALDASDGEQRARELKRQLHDYREGAEARIRELESRLRDGETVAVERERAAGARAAELETRLRKAETALDQRERAAQSAREEYRQGAQVRVAEVEARLRDAESAVVQRDLFVDAARRRAEEAEQEAAQRIAQSEHNAWLRITDLQSQLSDVREQLAASQEAASGRTSLRDRWRRS